MSARPVALIESADRALPVPFRALRGVEVVSADALDGTAPERWSGAIVGMHADQRRLAAGAGIAALLRAGRRVLFNGHHAYPVLPGVEPFRPLGRRGGDALALTPLRDHPVFHGLDRAGLARRKGVMGFYGRGTVPPPPGARPVTGIGADGRAVDWDWEPPEGGGVFMHAGNDIWTVAERADDRVRIAGNCVAWAAGEPAR